jgi:tRNA pseudouridine55 synthase
MKKAQFVFPRRPVDGMVLLDKPQGLSSNQALQKVRNLFRAEKAGHTGALDPLATGVLPICLGEATKAAGILLGNDKAYRVSARLGISTDTDDAEGSVLLERSVSHGTAQRLESLLSEFTGDILQVPPIYSALKQGGEPLYVKARRGESIDLPARPVSIRCIRLLQCTDSAFTLEVECGSGTYIRSLVRDLGERLGCGAHVTALRRLWVEPFRDWQLFSIEALQMLAEQGDQALDAVLLPVERALVAVARCQLDADQARRVAMGQAVYLDSLNAGKGLVQLCDEHGRSLGLATVDVHGRIHVQRLFRWAAIN